MQTSIHFDGKDATINHVQDVEAILERNKELRTQEQRSDWGRHVASIPNVIYVQWFNEEYTKGNKTLRMYSAEFDAIVQKKLADPEWAYLRCDTKNTTLGWMRKQAAWSAEWQG